MNLCLWNKLPKSLIDHIYGFDSTFKSKMNDSLNLIKHFTPTCSCDGGIKNLQTPLSIRIFWCPCLELGVET